MKGRRHRRSLFFVRYTKLFHVKRSYRTNIEQQNLLKQFLKEYILSELSKEQMDKLYGFADLVVETKQFGNLISAKDSEKFLSRHIADSLMPYFHCCQASIIEDVKPLPSTFKTPHINDRWANMGAGAGCPVFPLAIAMPEVQFYAVEPRHMRVEFMKFVKEKLHLDNLTVVGKRFETSGLAYLDFVSCRALSTFENDWERAQPGLKRGGKFLTLKSFNNIVHLESNPEVHIYKYALPQEEQVYALVTRGNE